MVKRSSTIVEGLILPSFGKYFAILAVGVVMLWHNPQLIAAGWSNVGFVALTRAFRTVPTVTLLRPQVVSQVNGEWLSRAHYYFSQAIFETYSGAYGLGLAYLAQGKYVQAAQSLQTAWPYRRALAGMYLGHALYQQGEKEEALKVWRVAPEVQIGLREQARSLLARGLVNNAIALFTRITEIAPDSVQAWLDLGEGYANQGDWLRVAEAYNKALALEPDNPDLQLLQAPVLFRLHKDAATAQRMVEAALPRLRAINSFEDELRLYNTYIFLSQLAQAQGRLNEAIEWLKQAMALPRVGDRWAMAGIAHLYQSKGDRGQAIAWMERALTEAPDDYSMYSSLGFLLWSQEDLEGARRAFERAIELAPNVVGTHNTLAALLSQMSKNAEAASEFRKALTLDPTNVTALEGLRQLGVQP